MSDRQSFGYLASAGLSGALFGLGLYVSQMTDPLKVLRFLDIGAVFDGGWDPSLAFVIVPAILVAFIANRVALGMKAPLFNGKFHLPRFHRNRPSTGYRRGPVRYRLGPVRNLPRPGHRAHRFFAAKSASVSRRHVRGVVRRQPYPQMDAAPPRFCLAGYL